MFPRSHRARLALACLACALVRLPAFRYDVLSDDEAIYDAMARVVTDGGVMYRDTVDHKPPGLVLAYATAQRIVRALGGGIGAHGMDAVHLLGLLAAVATGLALYGIGRRLLAPSLWLLPPLLYGLVSAAKQPVDGLAVNGELLMNLPIALAILAALEAGHRRGAARIGLDLSVGALAAVATLYKYQAAVALAALPALLLLTDGERPSRRLARLCAWALGFAIPLGLTLAFFARRGALDDALRWGVLFNLRYVAEGPGLAFAAGRLGLQLVGVVLPGAVVYGGGLLTLARLLRRAPQADVLDGRAFLVTFTLLSLASVCIGWRFFGHYFLQPELPLSLLAAGPAARIAPRRLALGLGAPALAFFFVAALPSLSRPILNARDPDYRVIGRAIAARTSPADTIWVWGNAPQIYHDADRLQGVRFSFCNYLTGLSPGTPSEYVAGVDPRGKAVPFAWPLVVEDLERRKPKLVLDTSTADLKSYGKFPLAGFPALAGYLAAHYRGEAAIEGIAVYRRID